MRPESGTARGLAPVRKSGRASRNPDRRLVGAALARAARRREYGELLVERGARDPEELGGEDLLALGGRERRADGAALRVGHHVRELERGTLAGPRARRD